jgi:superfamily II DNA or RNA helicase
MIYTFNIKTALTDQVMRQINAYPGVKALARRVTAPDNACFLVSRDLDAWGYEYEVSSPKNKPEPLENFDKLVENGLREWVPNFLTQYQRDGIKEMAGRSGMLIWAAGSGKTLASICWALHTPGRTVLCTRAPVRKSHGREIEKYTTKRAFVVEGESAIDFRERTEDFIVLGYETLPAHIDNLLRWRPQNLILDESHKIKSNKRFSASPREDGTVQFQMLDNIASAGMRLSRAVDRTLCTTATPVKDRVRDLWGQLDLAQPGEWGPFYRKDGPSWAGRYCAARPGSFGGIDTSGAANMDELWDRVSVISDQVTYSTTHRDLPPKRRIVTYVPQSEQVRATGFQKDFKAAARGGATSMLEVRLMEAAAKKRKFLMGLLSDAIENKQKVVVFTGRRADCENIGEETTGLMKKLDSSGTVLCGHGGTPSQERDQMQQKYMSTPGPCILIGTGDAWGEGVNLHDSDLMIISMLPYTPGQVIQWEGRVSRRGMTRPVMIQYLVAENTVDEHVAGILVSKLPAVESMVGDDAVDGFGNQLLTGDMTEEEFMDQLLGKLGLTSEDAKAEEE